MIGLRPNAKAPECNEPPTTRRVNVTGMTQSQRRQLFIDHLNRGGFTGFTKRSEGEQTYYTFTYAN